jgi:protein TonB
MKKILFSFAMLLACSVAFGKPAPLMAGNKTAATDSVYAYVDQTPMFPGGVNAFNAFVQKNLNYPDAALKNHTRGRVIVSFIVEVDGSLTNFTVKRPVGDGTDEESIRVLALSPKWEPGSKDGKHVRVLYTVPIAFPFSKVQ